ncbi:MAG: hypothetical protein M1825_004543 [Sarcosagium campestre]|nr:MAG: hypothetical protein M1825_004543 [Sarcosagium campestre]
MSYQRGLIRLSSRLPGQLRAQTLRTPLQRRLQSSNTETVLKGNEDNAFNRERQDIKDHASATSDLWRKLSL